MKCFTTTLASILAGMMLVAGAQAAEITKLPIANRVTAAGPSAAAVLQAAACPNPYDKNVMGVNESQGEYYCLKANIACPSGFTGSMDAGTGKMICTPVITASCPAGWTGGVVDGKLVCNSIPQPLVSCKYTDNNGATQYYKESWNRMGCRFLVIPK